VQIYRNIIPSAVLYGCETWSLTLKKEHRLRVFESRVFKRIFGQKWNEVTGEWRKVHNEDINDLYCSPNTFRVIKSRRMRWARNVARVGEGRDVYMILVGKSEEKEPLWRPKRRWKDNINDGSSGSGIWGDGLDRDGSGYEQMAGICECVNEPSGSIKCGEFLD